jgi:hypothetical protein
MEKEWWEIALHIVALLCSHAICMLGAASWVRDHYEHKLRILRYKARILTGIDLNERDGRFPD